VKKISATILDFARPLTDGLGDDTPIEIRRETLQLAITLWNCLVLLKHTKYRRDLRLVGDWELRDLGGGELSLRAVAHDPGKKRTA
jgi:hypothetical protein